MKTIVWATDGSKLAKKSGEIALQLLEAFKDSRLIALYVEKPSYEGNVALPTGNAERHLATDLKKQIEVSFSTFGSRIQFMTRVGNPSEVICKIADENQADVILIGSHGHNALERIFIGSVSHAVLEHASCPVMVIR